MRLVILLGAVALAASVPLHDYITPRPGEACGYESCTGAEDGLLNVHIVAHTHDDVGWLKTVDEYYYGSNTIIQKAGVQYILDSVIKELWEDPKRKFIYVETAFFWKWWNEQSQPVRDKVHTLVRQGRLQFVGGAWSMNDEAASHYQSTTDQFTWGLQKLNDTFGACGIPRVGWQIDPFGHSREFASLLAGMGYDGLFLGRIDYQDKAARLKDKNMEMLWRGDDDLGKSSDIFTGVNYNTYSPPPGFCFDVLCSDEPIIDNPYSPIYNVDNRIEKLLSYVREQAKAYRSGNVLLTMGGDFTYQDAGMWYRNLDKLIKYTNMKAAKDGLNIKLLYSTPTCYLKAVKDANPTLPVKQDDFFPYASDPNSYWTGYFTSRPTTKYFERQGNNFLQMLKQLQVLAGLEEHNMFVLDELKSAMGVMQHHDAITGTEKQKVTQDYERMLTKAVDDALIIAGQAYNKIMRGDALESPLFSFQRCRLNESRCEVSETSKQFVVTVYNHLAWNVNDSVRIPVMEGEYEVYAPNGDKITSQVVDIPKAVREIPSRVSKATYEIVFIAYLKPVSFKSFYVKKVASRTRRQAENSKRQQEFYENVNEYWAKVKETPFIDFNLKDDVINIKINTSRLNIDTGKADQVGYHATGKRVQIPDYPQKRFEGEVYDITDIDIEKDKDIAMLRDRKHIFDSDIEEFEKLKREAIKEGKKNGLDRERGKDGRYPWITEEEQRMMADDPQVVTRHSDDWYLENQHLKLVINGETGEVTHAELPDGTRVQLQIKYFYYPGYFGNNEVFANRSSGAYILRPNATTPIELTPEVIPGSNGPVVKEYRAEFSHNVASYVRIYDGLNYIESEWVVGPIDISDGVGKEYIVRYVTNIVNNGQFYTDSNGRQSLKRVLDKRPQWNVSVAEPVAANYYPVTNKIAIEGDSGRVAVIVDRSEGGTSLNEGDLELMLHRRLLHDDSFGVGEALNETANGKGLVVRGRQRIFLSKPGDKQGYIEEKRQVLQYHLEPQVLLANAEHVTLEQWKGLTKAHSFVHSSLPNGVHLLTLEPWKGRTLLLRLENYLELTDAEKTTVEVDLENIFNGIKVKNVRETTLAANQWLDERKQWEWKTESQFTKRFNDAYDSYNRVEMVDDKADRVNHDEGFKVKLNAREIRTFVVGYELDNLAKNNVEPAI